jgi:predicted dehydrogenase
MAQVRFGVIGVGSAWGFHSAGCAGSPVVKFVSVYDIDQARASQAAERHRANEMRAYGDLSEFLRSEIDAVLVMVPHAYHEDIVVQCAAAGKHVLCEKPMATTLEGCDMMIKATREAGVKFMIAENHRYLPAHQYVHDAIQDGLVGDVLLVRAFEGVNEIPGLSRPGFWKGDPIKAGGGCFIDMGAHKFAALEWILEDEVESVSAMLSKQVISLTEKAEDNALAMVRFANGALGEIVVSFTQMAPPFNSLEIYGTGGTILENHMWEKPVRIYSQHEAMAERRYQWFEPEIEHAPFPGYYAICAKYLAEHFARCVLEDREPEFTPEQAKSAIAGVLMGYLSAHTGKAASRDDLMKLAASKGTRSLLEDLTEHILTRKQPEVNR